MKINGKEINFEYTIGAFCDYSDYCADNPDVSLARANAYKALYMNRAYAQAHEGAETVTIEEIMNLPFSVYAELREAMKQAEEEGNKRSVETVEKKRDGEDRK